MAFRLSPRVAPMLGKRHGEVDLGGAVTDEPVRSDGRNRMSGTLRTVVHEVLAILSPGELDDVDVIIDAAATSPGAAMRAARSRNDPTASGPDLAQEVIAAVGSNLVSDLILLLGGGLLGRLATKLRRLPRKRVDPDAPLPPLPAAEVPAVLSHLERNARARGLSEEQARDLARAIVESWPSPS